MGSRDDGLAQGAEQTRHDSIDDASRGDKETQAGLGPTGVISLQTRFWAMGFLWLRSRTCVELDGDRHELPWGQLRVPVAAGRHRLRVSCKCFGMDVGAATKAFDVSAGRMVVLRYRAPVLIFLPAKLRLVGEQPVRPEPEMHGGLPSWGPSQTVTPGWYADPSDGHQRRWWDGKEWTPAIFRPESTAWKVRR